MNRTIYILLGAAGAGKGTLSASLIKTFGFSQLSTGNLCREHIAAKTAIGILIEPLLAQGLLVPDSIVADMVVAWLQATDAKHIIFDGYPRTLSQAEALQQLLEQKLNYKVVIVHLTIDPQLLYDRILHRRVCSNKACGGIYTINLDQVYNKTAEQMQCGLCGAILIQRVDDTPEILKKRLELYFEQEAMIIDFYRKQGVDIVIIDASQSRQQVFEQFETKVLQRYDD